MEPNIGNSSSLQSVVRMSVRRLQINVNAMILRMIAGWYCHRSKKPATPHPASTLSIISSLPLVVSTNRTL